MANKEISMPCKETCPYKNSGFPCSLNFNCELSPCHGIIKFLIGEVQQNQDPDISFKPGVYKGTFNKKGNIVAILEKGFFKPQS
jgi:hypothetical protein